MTSGQETERVHSYNPRAHTGLRMHDLTSLKCPQLHAPVAKFPSRWQQTNYDIVSAICSGPMSSHWFSHSTLFSVTATHATALDAYIFWRHRSTRRGTSFHRWVTRVVKMLPPEITTTQQQCKPVLRPWLTHIFTYLSVLQVRRLFMHLRIGVFSSSY